MPPGSEYLTSTSVSGFFFVAGNTLNTSRGLWTALTDQYYIYNPKDTILSKDCTANCGGRTCTEDNGCGLPCLCSGGKICTENGTCIDPPRPNIAPVCPDNSSCGSANGTCFGNCPLGYSCTRGPSGKYSCQQFLDTTLMFGIFIILIIVAIAVAMIVFGIFRKSEYTIKEAGESKLSPE